MPGRPCLVLVLVLALGAGACTTTVAGQAAASRPPPPAVETLVVPSMGNQGSSAVLSSIAVDDGGRNTAVGYQVEDAQEPTPLAIESDDGIVWQPVEIDSQGGAARLVAVAAKPGGLVAVGEIESPRAGDTDLGLWQRSSASWRRVDSEGLVGEGTQSVADLAAGRNWTVLAGRDGAVPRVWAAREDEPFVRDQQGISRDARLMSAAVGDMLVVVGTVPDGADDRFVSWASADGEMWTPGGDGLGRRSDVTVNDVVVTDDGFLAVGGAKLQGPDHSPVVWRSTDGLTWALEADALSEQPGSFLSNYGNTADFAAAWPGGVRVGTVYGATWLSPDGRAPFVAEQVTDFPSEEGFAVAMGGGSGPVMIRDDDVLVAVDGRWSRPPTGRMPRLTLERSVVDVVTRGPDWVAVGSETVRADAQDRGKVFAAVWTSADGRAWERSAAEDPDLADAAMSSLSSWAGGLVAVGRAETFMEYANGYDARIWTSGTGGDWVPISAPALDAEPGEVIQLESVVGYGQGFLATGYFFDGLEIEPFILRSADGRTVERVPGLSPDAPGDLITLGVCVMDDLGVAVGVDTLGPVGRPAVWTTSDGEHWNPVDVGFTGSLSLCAVVGEEIVLGGSGEGSALLLQTTDGISFDELSLDSDRDVSVEDVAGFGDHQVAVALRVFGYSGRPLLWLVGNGESIALDGSGFSGVGDRTIENGSLFWPHGGGLIWLHLRGRHAAVAA